MNISALDGAAGTPPQASVPAAPQGQPGEQTPSSTNLDGMSPGVAAAYQAAIATPEGGDPHGAQPQSTPAPVTDPTQVPPAGTPSASPDFNVNDLSESDFADPAKYERFKAYAEGFAKRDQDMAGKLAIAQADAQVTQQYNQYLQTKQGTEFLISQLTGHLQTTFGVQPGQAAGAASGQPAAAPTGQPGAAAGDLMSGDPFGIDSIVDQRVEARLKEIEPYVQRMKHEAMLDQARTEVTQLLPAVNGALANVFAGANFTVDEVMQAVQAHGALVPAQGSIEQVVAGIANAMKLQYFDRVGKPAAPVAPGGQPGIPAMVGGAHVTPGIAIPDKANSTFEERLAAMTAIAVQTAS